MRRRRRLWVALLVLLAVATLLRVGLVNRHGRWADELFSLAMATGHSLEHPATKADPALGDYVEAPQPLPPSAYSRYLEHENPAVKPDRVLRAVSLSDTSPPLYYLLLYGWTRVLGTSDAALRFFSIAWALACVPLVWSLARHIGGRAAALPTVILFTFSPVCVFYSSEGRMYSLLWFWTLCTMWLTLKLWRWGGRPWPFLLWVSTGAAGFWTHYFFAFVWAAAFLWLLLHPGKLSRGLLWMGAALVGLLIFPWYVRVPELLAAWRVTSYWLNLPPSFHRALYWPYLPWSFFSLHGIWGVRWLFDGFNAALFLVLAGTIWKKLSSSLFAPRRRLLWLWLAAACLGPVVFDLLRGTYVVTQARYALAGMPAAFLLLGLGLSRLSPRPRTVFLVLVVLAWLLPIGHMYRSYTRAGEPFREVGQLLAEQTGASDLVIVHSVPSGVIGVARYMESHGTSEGVGFASWVGQLKQRRVPEDLQRLAAGRRRIILVKICEVGEPAPQETWLQENATPAGELSLLSTPVTIRYFTPRGTDTFPSTR
jgi:hypothetical protein